MKKIITLLFLSSLFPTLLWGSEFGYSASGNLSELEKIAVYSYLLTYYIGLLLGMSMFFLAVKRLIANGKNPNDPRNSLGGVVVLMIGAGLLFGLQSTISMGVTTFSGAQKGHCFIYSDQATIEGTKLSSYSAKSDCFDASSSELTKSLREKLINSGKEQAAEKLASKLKILFTVFQAIGLIYFVKAIYMLKAITDGNGQTTYGKIVVMLIVSSLVIDMPDTLEILISTAKEIASTT